MTSPHPAPAKPSLDCPFPYLQALSEEHPTELDDDEGHEDAGTVLEEGIRALLVTPDVLDGGRKEHHDGDDSDDDADDVSGMHAQVLQDRLQSYGNGVYVFVLCRGCSGEEDRLHENCRR